MQALIGASAYLRWIVRNSFLRRKKGLAHSVTWHAARKRSERVACYGKGVMFVPLARFPRFISFAILLFCPSFFFLLSLIPRCPFPCAHVQGRYFVSMNIFQDLCTQRARENLLAFFHRMCKKHLSLFLCVLEVDLTISSSFFHNSKLALKLGSFHQVRGNFFLHSLALALKGSVLFFQCSNLVAEIKQGAGGRQCLILHHLLLQATLSSFEIRARLLEQLHLLSDEQFIHPLTKVDRGTCSCLDDIDQEG